MTGSSAHLSDGVTAVERLDATVHRTQGPWSPAVHTLLTHLRERGFAGAPKFLGIDDDGREVLDFIEGVVPCDIPADDAAADRLASSVGTLLRALHDATTDLVANGLRWQLPTVEPVEVICHNDVAPYNCVVRGGAAVALIDFDTASPGPRAWDLAYALYRFAPFVEGSGEACRQGERARLLLEGYGAAPATRVDAIRLLPGRLMALVDFMQTQAGVGNQAYRHHIDQGHADAYRRDIANAVRHRQLWTSIVTAGAGS